MAEGESLRKGYRSGIWLLLMVAGIALFYAFTLREGHVWGDDFAQYLHHAVNIAEGRDYRAIHFISNPLHFIAPPAYPPLLPLVLAPVYHLYGLDLTAMKLAQLACFCLALLVIGKLFSRSLPVAGTLAAIALFALNPHIWEYKDHIQSEYLFLLFSFLSLWLMERHYARGDARVIPGIGLLLGLSMYLAYGTREIGVVLPLTLVCYEIVALRRLTRTALLALGLFLLLALLQKTLLASGPVYPELQAKLSALAAEQGRREVSHTSIFRLDPGHIARQVLRYGEALKDFWSPHHWTGLVVAVAFTLFALAGYARRLWLRISAAEIYTAGYLAVLVLFSGFQGLRYLLPVIPLYLFYAFIGVRLAGAALGSRAGALLFAALMASAGLVYLHEYRQQDFSVIAGGVSEPDARAMFDYIRQATGPGDIVVFRKPRAMGLFTQRDISVYPPNFNPPLLLRFLDVLGADYVVCGRFEMDRRTLQPVIEQYPQRFLPVFSSGGYTVYRYART